MTWPVHRSSSAPMRLCRQRGLRKGVAEHAAQAAAGGIHVALHALQAHLRREVRLGLHLRSAQAISAATADQAQPDSSLRIIGTLLR